MPVKIMQIQIGKKIQHLFDNQMKEGQQSLSPNPNKTCNRVLFGSKKQEWRK